MNYSEYALIFKALGDETRVKILEMLSKEKLCACKILEDFNITQPTLSHHMKKLYEAGLVTFEKDGKWNHYQINRSKLNDINNFINRIYCIESNINSRDKGEYR